MSKAIAKTKMEKYVHYKTSQCIITLKQILNNCNSNIDEPIDILDKKCKYFFRDTKSRIFSSTKNK